MKLNPTKRIESLAYSAAVLAALALLALAGLVFGVILATLTK